MAKSLKVDTLTARQVCLCGSDGEPRLMLSVNDDGLAAVSLFDLAGTPRTALCVDANGSAWLTLNDRRGDSRIQVAIFGEPTLAITGRDGRAWMVTAMDDGQLKAAEHSAAELQQARKKHDGR